MPRRYRPSVVDTEHDSDEDDLYDEEDAFIDSEMKYSSMVETVCILHEALKNYTDDMHIPLAEFLTVETLMEFMEDKS